MSFRWFDSIRIGGVTAIWAVGLGVLPAQVIDRTGILALRQWDPSLTGSNVVVGQVEGGTIDWQVNPAVVGQPTSLFTWRSSAGTATTFPNALGTESAHGNEVGRNFYGTDGGVAMGVAHVHNFQVEYFYGSVIALNAPIDAQVVSQSFIFDPGSSTSVPDTRYDNYIVSHNTVIVSAVGNGGPPSAPATSWNSIGVAAYGGLSSEGPTADGRSKPDITAPAGFTSFAAPQVAGAAALLIQAGARGDAGAATATAATNALTVKALLLTGASKPPGWQNIAPAPLDRRFGAGILDIYRSYLLLKAGRFGFSESTTGDSGTTPPAGSVTNVIPSLRGWNLSSLSAMRNRETVHHYYFELSATADYTATATLVWNRQLNQSSVNNLDLVLRRVADNVVVSSSSSSIDNVEHVWLMGLSPGGYDLQVIKRGGTTNWVSNAESYALALEFAPEKLSIQRVNDSLQLSWQTSSVDLTLQGRANFEVTPWTNIVSGVQRSNQYRIFGVNPQEGSGFFRLIH